MYTMKIKLPLNCAIKLPSCDPLGLKECGTIVGELCARNPKMPGWGMNQVGLGPEFSGYIALILSDGTPDGVIKWCTDWCTEAASFLVDPEKKVTALGSNPLFAYFEFTYQAISIVIHSQCTPTGAPPLIAALQHVTHRMIVGSIADYCVAKGIQYPAFRLAVRNLGRDLAALPQTQSTFGAAPGTNILPAGKSIDRK